MPGFPLPTVRLPYFPTSLSCFGSRRSLVQIQSPRLIISKPCHPLSMRRALACADALRHKHDLSDSALAKEVRRVVARVSAAGLFSGIVTVARDTQVIVRAVGGYANRATHTPVTGWSQFTLGSMGKIFTAASIGQLVDRGKISFDDHVGKFFPDYPNATARDHGRRAHAPRARRGEGQARRVTAASAMLRQVRA